MKETFILRTEWHDSFLELNDFQKAKILDNLFYYHKGETSNIDITDINVRLIWKLIEPNLCRNSFNYDKRCETSAKNGYLGGRPKKENNLNNLTEKPNKPIETLNDSDSDSDSDSVIECVNDNVIIEKKTKNFVIPTVEEIKTYCIERKNTVDEIQFFNYYNSKGWMIGKNKMKYWKSAVITWERNSFSQKPLTAQSKNFKDKNYGDSEDIFGAKKQ